MANRWDTKFPADLDTLSSFPTVANLIDVVDATHVNELATAVRALEELVGSDNIESGSLRYLVNQIPTTTLANLNNKISDATLIDTTDSRLSDARTPLAHTHTVSDITDFVSHTHTKSDITDFTHTHTASDVTDFDTEVSNNASVAANTAHLGLTNNPHSVTAAQVGNTTAQWNANQIQGRAVTTDAPSDGKALIWNALNSALEWGDASGGATVLTDLTDTPANYTDSEFYLLRVNSAANAVEFVVPSGLQAQGVLVADTLTTGDILIDSIVTSSYETVLTDTVDVIDGEAILLTFRGRIWADQGGAVWGYVRFKVDGSLIDAAVNHPVGNRVESGMDGDLTFSEWKRNLTAGTHTVTVECATGATAWTLRTGAKLSIARFRGGSGGGLEYLTDLIDTPNSYSGHANKYVAVNSGETAVEFISPPTIPGDFVDLGDTPSSLSGQGSKYVAVNSGASALEFIAPPSIPNDLTDLGDTPANYTGYADYFVKVKTDETGVEFVAPSGTAGTTEFTGLTDTPANYSGHAHKNVRVNITEDGLEFVAPSGTAGVSNFVGLDDTPANYDAAGHYMVRVKSDLTGLEFAAPSGVNFDEAFTDLTDTPANYDGAASYFVKVKPDQTGLEFIAPSGVNFDETFLGLTDTPGSYAGSGGSLLVVNTAEDAVVFSGIRRVLEDEFTADNPDGNNRQTFTLTVTTAANADTPSGRDIRGVYRNGNRQKYAAATPGNREYTMAANNQVTVGGLVLNDDIEIVYGG